MALADSLAKKRPQSTLLPPAGAAAMVKPVEPEPETAAGDGELGQGDDFDPLPQPGDPYVKAYATTRSGLTTTLHVLLATGVYRGFAWSNYDSVDMVPGDKPGSGPVMLLRFAGLVPTELRISGSNPGMLHACLGRQRVLWIRERPASRGFAAGANRGGPADAIESINVNPWQPEGQGG